MKTILAFCLLCALAFAQDEQPYFHSPYFERYYSLIDFTLLANLDVTLAIREVVKLTTEVTPSQENPAFGFMSRKQITTDVHDLLESMYSPLYAGDTLAYRQWLETYYTQDELASDMNQYYYDDFYREALAGRDDFIDTKDFADVMMMFLTSTYVGVNLLHQGTPAEQDLALRQQIRAALTQSPRFNALNDEEKQRGAALLLYFTSRIFGDFGTATNESVCAAEDTLPGATEASLSCGQTTDLDLVASFAEGVAQVFGFRVADYKLTEKGFIARN